jgi:hypothetical protein
MQVAARAVSMVAMMWAHQMIEAMLELSARQYPSEA